MVGLACVALAACSERARAGVASRRSLDLLLLLISALALALLWADSCHQPSYRTAMDLSVPPSPTRSPSISVPT